MSSSGYTPLPSDPPPAYAAGTTNSAFAGGYTDDHNKDASHPAVPPAMPPYQGVLVYLGRLPKVDIII